MKKLTTIILAAMMAFSAAAPANAFFWKKEVHPEVFTNLPDECPKSKGWSVETNGKVSERTKCIIKKVYVNKKGELSGVVGDTFYIVVQAEADGKKLAGLVTVHTKVFRKLGVDNSKELIKDLIKAEVKRLIKLSLTN